MNPILIGYLRLMRPANLPTAAADILAGVALSSWLIGAGVSSTPLIPILFLVIASVFLYAGGVVLNDVFDFEIDKVERPERALPSGLISVRSAALFGAVLLSIGVVFAFWVTSLSGLIAIALALAILAYDGFSKKYDFLGPLNMGLCRALNLLLGISIVSQLPNWEYACIPLIYIFAITLISRGEVHGDNKKHLVWAGFVYASVIFIVVVMALYRTDSVMQTIPFLTLFAFLVFRPLVKAYHENSPMNIKKAVISGVLSVVVLDAAIASGHTVWWYAVLILLLLPLSILLSKLFAVT